MRRETNDMETSETLPKDEGKDFTSQYPEQPQGLKDRQKEYPTKDPLLKFLRAQVADAIARELGHDAKAS